MGKAEEFVKVENIKLDLRKKEPPLVDLKVTNPVVYIKAFWKRVLGNEGMEIRIKLKPLTTIAITIIIITLTFGIGHFVLPFEVPFFEYTNPTPAITQPPLNLNEPDYRESGFRGELKYNSANKKYYLLTTNTEALNLIIPETVDLKSLIGKRIFAAGKYYPKTVTLLVESALDLEILPTQIQEVPTAAPTPTPITEQEPTPTHPIEENNPTDYRATTPYL